MLSLEQIRTLVGETAADLHLPAEVVAATPAGHDSAYVEVLLSIAGCAREPCRLVVALDRSGTTADVRRVIETRLREHPELHR